MKTISAISLVLSFTLLIGAAFADGKAPLDGKKFTVKWGEKGKPSQSDKDSMTFAAGKFRSSGCDPYGFGDGPYTAKSGPDGVKFEADTQSAKEGKIHWVGMVKGDSIKGTYVWTKTGQAPIEYWFESN